MRLRAAILTVAAACNGAGAFSGVTGAAGLNKNAGSGCDLFIRAPSVWDERGHEREIGLFLSVLSHFEPAGAFSGFFGRLCPYNGVNLKKRAIARSCII